MLVLKLTLVRTRSQTVSPVTMVHRPIDRMLELLAQVDAVARSKQTHQQLPCPCCCSHAAIATAALKRERRQAQRSWCHGRSTMRARPQLAGAARGQS